MKGQVSGFAIVGILVIIAVAGLVWISRPAVPGQGSGGPTLDIENCIETNALNAIRDVGRAGGMDPDDASVYRELGANPWGISPTTSVRRALIPYDPGAFEYGPDENHYFESNDLTALNRFPRFENDPLWSTSDVLTERITSLAERCAPQGGTLDVQTVTYSDTSVVIRTSIAEPGRSRYEATVTLPVPIRTYHQMLRRVIQLENTDPEHSIASITVSGDYRIFTHPHDAGHTIVIVESNRPLLGTEPFRYLTIIDNRPPVFLDDPTTATTCADLRTKRLVDPDDGHTPEITHCVDDPNSGVVRFEITSGTETYEVVL